MDVDDFLALSASRLDMCDLDSVSQISAMDSASQTGSVNFEPTKYHHHSGRPIFSSDSNIHRSLAETLPGIEFVYLWHFEKFSIDFMGRWFNLGNNAIFLFISKKSNFQARKSFTR